MLKTDKRDDEQEDKFNRKLSIVLLVLVIVSLIVSVIACLKKYEETKTVTAYRTISQDSGQQAINLSSKETFKSYKVYEQEDAVIIVIEKE